MNVFGCQDHFDTRSAALPLYENVTKVTDYAIPPNGNGISPYERPHLNHPADFSCVPADPCCCNEVDAECNGNVVGYQCCELPYANLDWPSLYACQASESRWNNGNYWNCFSYTHTTFSMAHCYKYGFKNVFAKKIWHGRHSYGSRNNGVTGDGNYSQGIPDEMGWCGACPVHHVDPSPDPVKYLNLTATCHIDGHYTGVGGYDFTADAWGSSSVDRYSGTVTNTCASSSSDSTSEYLHQMWADSALGELGVANNDNTFVYGLWWGWVYYYWEQYGYPNNGITGDGVAYQVSWFFEGGTKGQSDYWSWEVDLTCDMASGTATRDESGGGSYAGGEQHDSYTYSGTSMTHNFNGYGYTRFNSGHVSGTTTATLSNPYTSAELYNDLRNLMNQFPLNDDVIYPWRTDSATTSGPLVTFDEVQGIMSPYMSGNDSSDPTGTYTGKVLGKPHPFTGASFWDARWEHWDHCLEVAGSGNDHWYILGYGGWSQYASSATQWTNLKQSSPQSFYPELVHGPRIWFDGQIIYGSKWAETLVHRPSVNYFRPCGADRWTLSASMGYNCISSRTDNVLHLNYTFGETVVIQPDTTCSVVGTDIPGIYIVDDVSGYDITLGRCLVSASAMPYQPVYDGGHNTGYICQLRWPDAPAICGIIPITNVTCSTTGSPVTMSLEQPSWLIRGDRVYVADVKGATHTNGFWTVQEVISPYTIILSGSVGAMNAPYKGSGSVRSPFTPDPAWNNHISHYTYGIKTWDATTGFRDVGEYQRLYNRNGVMQTQTGCSDAVGNWSYCGGCSVPSNPREAQAAHGLSQYVTQFSCSTYYGKWSPCSPYVVAFGYPSGSYTMGSSQGTSSYGFNGDTFKFGKTFYFPNDIAVDTRYGSVWAAEIAQDMVDPFAQEYPCPCSARINPDTEEITGYDCECGWRWDDGNCNQDQEADLDLGIPCIRYAPHQPIVEFLCAPTGSAPALPPGVYIGCLTQAQVAAGAPGIVCNYLPPGYTGNVPWILWAAEDQCVCGEGRFAEYYKDDGVRCIVVT